MKLTNGQIYILLELVINRLRFISSGAQQGRRVPTDYNDALRRLADELNNALKAEERGTKK